MDSLERAPAAGQPRRAGPTRKEFIAAAYARLHQPTTRAGWGNCVGYLASVWKDTGNERLVRVAEPYLGHAEPPTREALYQIMCKFLEEIPVDEARPGDLLLYAPGGVPRHVALLVEPEVIIHADRANRKVIDQAKPRQRPYAAFAIPELI